MRSRPDVTRPAPDRRRAASSAAAPARPMAPAFSPRVRRSRLRSGAQPAGPRSSGAPTRRQPVDWQDRRHHIADVHERPRSAPGRAPAPSCRCAADVSLVWASSALTAASMPSGFRTRRTSVPTADPRASRRTRCIAPCHGSHARPGSDSGPPSAIAHIQLAAAMTTAQKARQQQLPAPRHPSDREGAFAGRIVGDHALVPLELAPR